MATALAAPDRRAVLAETDIERVPQQVSRQSSQESSGTSFGSTRCTQEIRSALSAQRNAQSAREWIKTAPHIGENLAGSPTRRRRWTCRVGVIAQGQRPEMRPRSPGRTSQRQRTLAGDTYPRTR